ncbi:4a-hydroxytetrahydrobiopterin dehydratase [Alicyclobacillus vulcanalis]|uniref:4a-hydroxytetrahydrobiopterin dehydratase n=1 Tax=Alicyclobacillus vulcanalis TaxID=252246 RepID=A0A1N7PU59_9BACL|nr:4a-hydroxytetrahydrobiopterin dehydratase [Alicyclobacillus vulcanalis]SIT14116.1 4a-hydroxytetrahydrobiopterin dehydratase [Alicyclobacillus vulcanalis]
MKWSESEIEQGLAELPGWQRDGQFIRKRYGFESFADAIAFVNRVAEIAERRNHHPFISIDYKYVTLRFTTWHAGGLTAEDFEEAKEIEAVYASKEAT